MSKIKKCYRPIKLLINNQAIGEVNNTKFLGVIIDKKTNWKDHINNVAGKVSRAIGMLVKAERYLKKEALITLYYPFVYPNLTYCNHIWGATYVSNLMKFIKLQNRIVRVISNAKYRESAHPLYKTFEIMKFVDINKYLIARFMFRYCNDCLVMTWFQANA